MRRSRLPILNTSPTDHRRAWWLQTAAAIGRGAALMGFGYAPKFAAGVVLIFVVGACAGGVQLRAAQPASGRRSPDVNIAAPLVNRDMV